jgi:hypothetical protein
MNRCYKCNTPTNDGEWDACLPLGGRRGGRSSWWRWKCAACAKPAHPYDGLISWLVGPLALLLALLGVLGVH